MPGSFDLSPVPGGQATTALPVYVAKYDPSDEENPYTILPNVRCLRIDYREGPEPPLARFQYFMDDLLQAPWAGRRSSKSSGRSMPRAITSS